MNSLEMPLMIPRTALVFTLVAVAVLLPRPARAAPPHRDGAKWVRIFDDEFDGATLDAAKWTVGLPEELMGEPPYLDAAHVRVEDGRLIITATREAHPGAPSVSRPGGKPYSRDFTSGAVHTKGKFGFTHGYAEARLRMPSTRGTSPAFWMLPTDGGWLPEIDAAEVPLARTRVYCTYHWSGGAKGARSWSRQFDVPDLSAGFHDYGVEWTDDYLAFYIDGKQMGRFTNSHAIARAKDMYIILSLVAGGWADEPTSDAPFPTSLEADWVRVWQRRPARSRTCS
jgi:beta-glucanase (GH16 family)